MRQWSILYQKEMTEMWRTYKWVWVPLVFLLLGIMQPITTYFLPDILASSGSLPEGAVIDIPLPNGEQMMGQTLSQYGMMGVLILVLAMMAAVSGERNQGVAELIFVRPVTFLRVITAKWAGMVTLMTAAYGLSYMGAWYYTEQLIGPVAVSFVVRSLLLYWLWLVFVVSVTLLMSASFRSFGAAAFVSIGVIAGIALATNVFSKQLAWSPGRLPQLAALDLSQSVHTASMLGVVGTTVGCIAACILLAVYMMRQQQSLV